MIAVPGGTEAQQNRPGGTEAQQTLRPMRMRFGGICLRKPAAAVMRKITTIVCVAAAAVALTAAVAFSVSSRVSVAATASSQDLAAAVASAAVTNSASSRDVVTASAQQAASFPYPQLPASLTVPQQRAAYLLEHYWELYDFGDTALIQRPDMAEQGFSNFIDLLPRVDSLVADRGVEQFVRRAYAPAVPPMVRDYFAALTEHYLFDADSPMRSDELYSLFLQHMTAATVFDAATCERYEYLLANVRKNKPGTVAADFAYTDRAGRDATLGTTDIPELLMLYFYDPDCDHCQEITAELAADSVFAANQRLKVLAIYPYDDTALWRTHPQSFPPSWCDVYSPGGAVDADELYYIRATPTIYLLDSERRVLLKDPDVSLLRRFLLRYEARRKQ